MIFFEFLISVVNLSFLIVILSQILIWQQTLWHKLDLKIHQVYGLMLIQEQLHRIENDLAAICSILPLKRTKDGFAILEKNLVHLEGSRLDYPALQADVEWSESQELNLVPCHPGRKLFFSNFRESEISELKDCQSLRVKLTAPLMFFTYIEEHLDFKNHNIRIYQQGKPQTLVSGLAKFELEILDSRQLQWGLQFLDGTRFSGKMHLCQN